MTAEWITIQDVTTGSELFNGSAIYAYVEQITFSGGNNVGNNSIQGVNTELDDTLDGVGNAALSNNYNRRVGYNSYASFNNPIIKLVGNWTEEAGSLNEVGSLLTPYKLWRMVHSDHQFKIRGGLVIPNLIAGESIDGDAHDYSYYPAIEGIPFVFTSPWQMRENYRNAVNHVGWEATLRLDREE